MLVSKLVVGPLETNCYIFGCPETRRAIVIDPGAEGGRIRKMLADHGYELDKVVLTHGHGDHIMALDEVLAGSGAEVMIHGEDTVLLRDADRNLSSLLGRSFEFHKPVTELEDGQEITVGSRTLKVLHTPGHTRGSVSLAGEGLVFSGDTLFLGGVGRTDLPGGSMTVLMSSIRDKLLALPGTTKVYPGHGPDTTIRAEREENPYLDVDW